VVQEGDVSAGDPIVFTRRDDHGVTVEDEFRKRVHDS